MSDFATALNCMDGRAQLPVNEAVRAAFGAQYVDTITEAGIVKFLADEPEANQTRVAIDSIRISVEKHGSQGIAVAAHHDCAGNPVSDADQKAQLQRAVAFVKSHFADCRVIGLWVGDDWKPVVVTE